MAPGIELSFADLEQRRMYFAIAVVDKCIYAFPHASGARRVLCIDPARGASPVGEDLGSRDRKFVAAAVLDGCIYAIPFNARSIVRLDHRKNAFDTFDCCSQQAAGPQFSVAAVVDQCIYGMRRGGEKQTILRLDHGDVKNSTCLIPTEIDFGGYEATVIANHRIYRIPSSAPRALVIDPSAGTAKLIGPEMGIGGAKYHAAVLVGKYIYAIPCNASRVLCIDTSTDTAELIGAEMDGPLKYVAAAVVDGCVYGIPSQASRVLRIMEKKVDFIGRKVPDGGMKYCAAAVVGKTIYGIPSDARRILQIDHVAEEVTLVGDRLPDCSSKFHKAAVVGSTIYAFPWEEKYILRIDVGGRGAGAPTVPTPLPPPPLPPPPKQPAAAAVAQGLPRSSADQGVAIAIHPRGGLTPVAPSPAPAGEGAEEQVIGHAIERAINRWGLDIANALTGSYQFFPMGYVPPYTAEDCLKHVRFACGKGFTATEVFKQATGKVESMPSDRKRKGYIMVVYAWTLECEFYRALTTSMRRARSNEAELKPWRCYIYHFERALAMQPGFRGKVFRGVDKLIPTEDGYEPGRTITWQSFSSATRSELNLTRWLNQTGRNLTGTIFVIDACNARCVQNLSHFPNEEEVVFVPNTHFLVKYATRRDGDDSEKRRYDSEKRRLLPKLSEYSLDDLKVFELQEL